MTRLFVAVWPPAHAIEHIRRLPREAWDGLRWTPERNWHVTLRFVGEAQVDHVVAALTDAELPAAEATVRTQPYVLAGTSLVLPVTGVDELAAAVVAATAGIGRSDPPGTRFRGHLTVARSRGKRRITPISGAGELPDTITFEVDEIAVVESTLSSAGAEYRTVASFRTGGGR